MAATHHADAAVSDSVHTERTTWSIIPRCGFKGQPLSKQPPMLERQVPTAGLLSDPGL
jgi:hypothetical protein